MLPNCKSAAMLAVIIIFIFAVSPAMAAENDKNNDNLEWRLELIEASRRMMEEVEELEVHYHRMGTMITTFPDDGARVNGGLSLTPHLTHMADNGAALRGRAELFYLQKNDEFAGFLSLILAPRENAYFGVGGEIIGAADYQIFAGWEPTNNLFLELRAVNTGKNIWDSEIHPAAGFQMKF